MRITLVGSRHFGVTTLNMLREHSVSVVRVVVADAEDRLAAQDWCFVKKGETARELWERALAPLGLKLLADVIDYAKVHKALPAKAQDEQFATSAPSLS
ncbi:formyl transferase [Bradyrhizobium liaoningense]|uniref:hypothetical protein n=1 Tax=Bradyrhizobium liaoningense TaxID=43992 RepID=UPI00235C0BF4|nr:hypothetical protein [Bradyrhizobium liaoningense]GLR96114.1 hypothetical protein GCM10007858_37510 [Bradyrhizobium liaoningense]